MQAGLLDVTGRLFGVEYRPVPDAPVWHPDVAVLRRAGAATASVLGRIYLDLHPREGKYKHAAQFDLVAGVTGRQLPEGVLVCNFPRGLMEHADVVTLFHEFGHLVHHVLGGRQRWVRFSGVATEWDFVEAPSQMLEEWAWDAEILRSFAHRRGRRSRSPPSWWRGCGRRRSSARAISPVPRCSTPRCPTGCTWTGRPTSPPRCGTAGALRPVRLPSPGTHFQDVVRSPGGLHLGVLHLHVEPGDRQGHVLGVRPDDLFDAGVAHRYRDADPRPRRIRGRRRRWSPTSSGRPYSFDAFGAWLDTPIEAPR